MSQVDNGFLRRIAIPVAAALAAALFILLAAAGYWRLESLSWVSHRHTQAALHSLSRKVEGLDGKITAALQELETLRREQEAVRSRIEHLEAQTAQASDLQGEIEALKQDQRALQASVTALSRQLDDLPAMREDLITIREGLQETGVSAPPAEGELSSAPTSLGVPLYGQSHDLSCEATTVSMVAAFFGVSLTEAEVIEALPRHENPNLGFRGQVDGPPGGLEDYGVHAAPIQNLLAEHGLRVRHVEGGLEGIRSALRAGHPVIAWITYHLWEQTPVELELTDGSTVNVVPYEHTVVIEGYAEDGLWALDPYDEERQLLPWADFERSWAYLGQMALEIERKSH